MSSPDKSSQSTPIANGSSPRSAASAQRGPKHQKGQQQINGESSTNKKQATPSQKRLQKQQQQQQQQQHGQNDSQHQASKVAASQTGTGRGPIVKTRELDVKVEKLTDKNENCKLKIGTRLEEFSRKAGEIKADISTALERQQTRLTDDKNVSASVEQLRVRLEEFATAANPSDEVVGQEATQQEASPAEHGASLEPKPTVAPNLDNEASQAELVKSTKCESSADNNDKSSESPECSDKKRIDEVDNTSSPTASGQSLVGAAATTAASKLDETVTPSSDIVHGSDRAITSITGSSNNLVVASGCFEPLSARLDPKSKYVALKLSLEKQFGAAPELLEPICTKLIDMSRQVDQLKLQNEFQQQEIGKLRLIKERLADLCRELQKSNNQIRIESLALIKGEQHKAKEQADKIQTTLAGVMKLFDENQQRNLSLKQENIDLQTKLKQLLEHCENWEQCVETAIKQRDIENRLVKTELTRLSLIRTEEQERFLKEKHDLLKALELMKTHQSRVEDKEAKLRSDLSSYANKYDQCQELIQNGLGKFQVESKRMLKQIEQSRQDYVALLNKYEASNKKIKQLLEEKHAWMKSTVQTSKKLETLEKLCRSLKSENDRLVRESSGSNNNNNRGAGGSLVETTTTGVGSSSIEPQEITCKGPNTTSVITTTPTTGQPDESPTGESLGQRVPLVIITNDQSQV